MTEQQPPERPWLRVVRGDPTPEELAALVAVLAARQAQASQVAAEAGAGAAPGRRSAWGHPDSAFRQPLRHGPDAWRRSALPS
jgi:hypothetical protein